MRNFIGSDILSAIGLFYSFLKLDATWKLLSIRQFHPRLLSLCFGYFPIIILGFLWQFDVNLLFSASAGQVIFSNHPCSSTNGIAGVWSPWRPLFQVMISSFFARVMPT